MNLIHRAIALMILIDAPLMAQAAGPTVRIESGTLAGARSDNVASFKNIPYAAPPVGDLRWRPPQPVNPWTGVRPATTVGVLCQQKYNAQDNGVGPLPMSEDCLTLNVFAPAGARKAPVMFWIHGGGFVNGSGTAALYDGTALAKQGVVVVTINYRLGRFGFFAHPALTAEAKGGPVANYALMDMIAALKWVRTNIAKFGGDPDQVTIFGESAGGASVNYLMVSPEARGLFSRAMSQSGIGREAVPALSEAEKVGVALAETAGLKDATAADLRKLTPEQILDALGGQSLAAAINDGKILPATPVEAFGAGQQAKVPFVIGWNSLEFPVPAAIIGKGGMGGADSVFDASALARIKAAYPDPASYELHLASDVIFTEPALNLARLHAAGGNPTYVYQMSVLPKSLSDKLKGTPHALDRDYVFNNLIGPAFGPNDAVQAQTISGYWASFAKTGNPNGGGRPDWPLFDSPAGRIIDFTNHGPKVAGIPRQEGLDAVAETYR